MKSRLAKIISAIVLSLMLFPTVSIPPVYAVSPTLNATQNATCSNCGSPATAPLAITSAGDTIIVMIEVTDGGLSSAVAPTVSSITDSQTNTYAKQVGISGRFGSGSTCASGECVDAEVWTTQAISTAADTVTIHLSTFGTFTITVASANDVSNVAQTAIGSASAVCGVGGCLTLGTATTPSTVAFGPNSISVGSFACAAGGCYVGAGTSYTTTANVNGAGGSEYSLSVISPTNYPVQKASGASTFYALVGATFGPGPSGLFTVKITNKDAGNYLVAGSKFYNFRAYVYSSGIAFTNSQIQDVQIRFNDSVNIIVVDYSNVTKLFTVIKGDPFIRLSGGTISEAYVAGVRQLNVTFNIALTTKIVDSINRGIELYAKNSDGLTRGFEYVQTNYFNIINAGGKVDLISSGACSIPTGADTFQTLCQYQASPQSWIAENSTWYHLQQFKGLFSIKLANNYGNPDMHLWQNYANSGGGAENSTNPGDWKIRIGLYHHDNTTWVKGINAVISMISGNQGNVDQWTRFNVQWYNGNSFVSNSTFSAWIEQDPLSQTTLWVNLWYSQNNASTSQGGRVAAYYTGMHSSGFLWWTSWSPFLQNDSSSSIFIPLLDHTGKVMHSPQAQFSKVFMNMSRPGAPAVHTGQINFEVITRAFQIESFGVAVGEMTSIEAPAFDAPVIPIIQNTGFFSPIIRAIQAIANFIIQGFQTLGNIIWAQLAARFPWFTNFWAQANGMLGGFTGLLSLIVNYLISILTFFISIFSYITGPISIITNAWGTIVSIYNQIFGTANLPGVVSLFVIAVVGISLFEAAMTGDFPFLIKVARQSWAITNAILHWSIWLAKLIIDTIEGLIP